MPEEVLLCATKWIEISERKNRKTILIVIDPIPNIRTTSELMLKPIPTFPVGWPSMRSPCLFENTYISRILQRWDLVIYEMNNEPLGSVPSEVPPPEGFREASVLIP